MLCEQAQRTPPGQRVPVVDAGPARSSPRSASRRSPISTLPHRTPQCWCCTCTSQRSLTARPSPPSDTPRTRRTRPAGRSSATTRATPPTYCWRRLLLLLAEGAGVASSTSVGLPAWSRTICPPGGSGVSLAYPRAATAGRLRIADWYRCSTSTGVSGAAALRSETVGRRFSANCAPVQRPRRAPAGPAACAAPARTTSAGQAQRRHPVPAQLKQVVHASADEVDVRVVKSGDHAMPERVDHGRTRPDQSSNVALIAHGG